MERASSKSDLSRRLTHRRQVEEAALRLKRAIKGEPLNLLPQEEKAMVMALKNGKLISSCVAAHAASALLKENNISDGAITSILLSGHGLSPKVLELAFLHPNSTKGTSALALHRTFWILMHDPEKIFASQKLFSPLEMRLVVKASKVWGPGRSMEFKQLMDGVFASYPKEVLENSVTLLSDFLVSRSSDIAPSKVYEVFRIARHL